MENSGKRGRQWMFPDVPKLNLQRISTDNIGGVQDRKLQADTSLGHSKYCTVSVNVHVDHEVHSSSTFCFQHCLRLLVEDNE